MKFICLWMAIVLCIGFSNAWANDQTSNNVLDKRFTFFGGIKIYQAEGDFRSTKDGRPEIEIDLDDLDLDKNHISPIAGVLFNFGKRWNLRFDYFGYHEDSKATAEFYFEFDDLVVPVGARVDSNLDLDVYAVNLAYNFLHSERARFGVGVGVHAVDIDLGISAKVTVAGKEISLGEDTADLIAPVPNVYAYGAYAFTEKFILRYGGGWLSANYGDFDGSFIFANAFLEYWPLKYAGFGAGYRYLAADLEYDPGSKTEEYDFKLPGPLLYVIFGF